MANDRIVWEPINVGTQVIRPATISMLLVRSPQDAAYAMLVGEACQVEAGRGNTYIGYIQGMMQESGGKEHGILVHWILHMLIGGERRTIYVNFARC